MSIRSWFLRWLAPRKDALEALPDLLRETLRTLSARLSQRSIDHAVIGGVALALHGEPRFTQDLDFLLCIDDAEQAHAIMQAAGFESLQRTTHFGNYRIGLLHVDFLFASGPEMRRMLNTAASVKTDVGLVKVTQPVDLIGLKLQALANNPERENDWSDIKRLITRFHGTMDLQRLRHYFVLFGREDALERLLEAARKKGGA